MSYLRTLHDHYSNRIIKEIALIISVLLVINVAMAHASVEPAPSIPVQSIPVQSMPVQSMPVQSISAPEQQQALQLVKQAQPLFEANLGQFDPSVRYAVRGPSYMLYLTASGTITTLPAHAAEPAKAATPAAHVLMQLLGARDDAKVEGVEQALAKTHYFVGRNASQWQTNAPNYAEVYYRGIYPGIDLRYYHNGTGFEYDFIVAPGVSPQQIQMSFAGMNKASLDAAGRLVLATAVGDIIHAAPFVYQEKDGQRHEVASRFSLDANRVAFTLADYDAERPLIIDPGLNFVTLLGGSGMDEAADVAVDADGNFYVAGRTFSSDFPSDIPGASLAAGYRASGYVTKFNQAGKRLYTTYIGSELPNENDKISDVPPSQIVRAIAVDQLNRVYMTGSIAAIGAPEPNFDGTFNRCYNVGIDAFVGRLDRNGILDYFGCLPGGDLFDIGTGIALIDPAGNFSNPDVFITGTTYSSGMKPKAYDLSNTYPFADGGNDAFVARLNLLGAGSLDLQYFTYLGGAGVDHGRAIAASNEQVCVTGVTKSDDLPQRVNALKPGPIPVEYLNEKVSLVTTDQFAACFSYVNINSFTNKDLTLDWLRYIGGDLDEGRVDSVQFYTDYNDFQGIALAAGGEVLIAGSTGYFDGASDDLLSGSINHFQAVNSTQNTFRAPSDGFLASISRDGQNENYISFLGGGQADVATDVAVDQQGSIYVVGRTAGSDFALADGQSLFPHRGGQDAFLSRFTPAGELLYSLYLGGGANDVANAVAVSSVAGVHIAGNSASTDLQGHYGQVNANGKLAPAGAQDAMVLRVGPTVDLRVDILAAERQTSDLMLYRVEVSNSPFYDAATDVTLTSEMPQMTFQFEGSSLECGKNIDTLAIECYFGQLGRGDSVIVDIVMQNPSGQIMDMTATVAADEFDINLANNDSRTNHEPAPDGFVPIQVVDGDYEPQDVPVGSGGGALRGALLWVCLIFYLINISRIALSPDMNQELDQARRV